MGGDLHCHTKLSDGSLGIGTWFLLAKKKGIETIAITDHDCPHRYSRENNRRQIRGECHSRVELSSRDEKTRKIRRYTLLSQRCTGQAPGALPQKLACP